MSEGVSTKSAGPGLRARQLEERRLRLVRAARTLLRASSNGDFSMLELAKEAGFSPATPYNLFGTKAAVLSAVYESEVAGFQQSLDPLLGDDPVAALLGTAEHIGGQFTRSGDFYRNLAASMSALALEEVRPAMVQLNDAMLGPLIDYMAEHDAFERWIAPSFLTGLLTRQLESVFFHWATGEWSSERLTAELRFGFGMALLGALRPPLRSELRKALKAAVPQIQQMREQWEKSQKTAPSPAPREPA